MTLATHLRTAPCSRTAEGHTGRRLPQLLPAHHGDLGRAVFDHLAAYPWSTSRDIAHALTTAPEDVTHALTRIERTTGLQRAGGGTRGNPYTYALRGVPRPVLVAEDAPDLREPLIREIVEAHMALDAAGVSRTYEGRVATLAERVRGSVLRVGVGGNTGRV